MVSCGCLNFNEHALEFERRALLNLITCFVLENFCLSVCVCIVCVVCCRSIEEDVYSACFNFKSIAYSCGMQ